MKKVKLISLILFSLFFIISVNAQEFICPEVGPVIENRMEKSGGYYKPASGTFRVLVVLAKLKNDSYEPSNPNWPAETGGLPPQNMLSLFNTNGTLNIFSPRCLLEGII